MKFIQEILKDSKYGLGLFNEKIINELNNKIVVRKEDNVKKYYSDCIIRDKLILLTPAEIVRQLYTKILIAEYGYPKKRINFDHPIKFGHSTKLADIVIFDKGRLNKEYIIVEIKKPKLSEGKNYLKSYCNVSVTPMGVWLNGDQIAYYNRKKPSLFEKLKDIPKNDQVFPF